MELRIKLFLAFLAVIAVFGLYKTTSAFRFLSLSSIGIPVINPLPAAENDTDHDGLSNREEDYWTTDPNKADTDGDGYADGDEVVNRYDPLIPGLVPIGGSITDQFANLTLSGFVEGSLKEDSPDYFQALDDITSSVLDSVEPKNAIPDQFLIVTATEENQLFYLESLKPIFKTFLVSYYTEAYGLLGQLENINKRGFADSGVTSFFSQYTNTSLNISGEFQDIKVPENWVTEHNMLSGLISDFRDSNVSIQRAQSDPINAASSLNKLMDIAESIPFLINAYEKKIQSEKLNMRNYFQSIQ